MEEVPGVNSQGKTRTELLKNLRSALKEALEFNREDALIIVNLSGRGDKDVAQVADKVKLQMPK